MTIEIVDCPIKNGGSFHSYVNVYQRVTGNSYQFLVSHPKVGQKTAILEPLRQAPWRRIQSLSPQLSTTSAGGTLGVKHQHQTGHQTDKTLPPNFGAYLSAPILSYF